MDIKEIGACAVVVIGGVVYGVSSGGLKDALSSDVRHIAEVSNEDRSDYMHSLVGAFSESFDAYIIQTETYDYIGFSKFSALPASATFEETVVSEESIPNGEISGIKAILDSGFCEQEEMTIFTEKGWSYKFSLRDSKRRVFSVTCRPDPEMFDYGNEAIG